MKRYRPKRKQYQLFRDNKTYLGDIDDLGKVSRVPDHLQGCEKERYTNALQCMVNQLDKIDQLNIYPTNGTK